MANVDRCVPEILNPYNICYSPDILLLFRFIAELMAHTSLARGCNDKMDLTVLLIHYHFPTVPEKTNVSLMTGVPFFDQMGCGASHDNLDNFLDAFVCWAVQTVHGGEYKARGISTLHPSSFPLNPHQSSSLLVS